MNRVEELNGGMVERFATEKGDKKSRMVERFATEKGDKKSPNFVYHCHSELVSESR